MPAPYPLEFRREAVALLKSSGKTVPQLASELGVSPQSLRNWARRIDVDDGRAEGLNSDEREELRRLRRELRTVTEEREILKKRRPSSPRKAGPGEDLRVHRGEAGRALDQDHVSCARRLAMRGGIDALRTRLTVRQLKAGTFEQFAEAFRPADTDSPPPGWMRFHVIRDTADENRVVTFGLFDGTLEDLQRSQVDHGYDERRAAAGEFVEDVLVDGVFEVIVDVKAE